MLERKHVHQGAPRFPIPWAVAVLAQFVVSEPKDFLQSEESGIDFPRFLLGQFHEVSEQVGHAHPRVVALTSSDLLRPLLHGIWRPSEAAQLLLEVVHRLLLELTRDGPVDSEPDTINFQIFSQRSS